MDEDRVASLLELPGFDFDGNGSLTISDAVAWLTHVLLLPGDIALELIMRYAPAAATYLELGPEDYGGVPSLTVSILFWLAVILLLGTIVSAIRDFDRWLSALIGSRLKEAARLTRVARRKISGNISQARQRRQEQREEREIGAPTGLTLEVFDAAVLRCYGNVSQMRMIAVDEVAKSLRTSMRKVKEALVRLHEHRLVEPSFGTDHGYDCHQITPAGRSYLTQH
jgi:hypothetical protein